MSLTRADRVRGALYGLLVGDALGVPYEFKPPHQLPPLDEIDMTPPAGFARSHARVPPGTWSDDGAHALALLDSLLTCGRLELDDFAQRLIGWYRSGRYAVGGDVFDVGIQTSAAIERLERGVPPHQAGGAHELENGNGSFMRVAPLALWHTGSDEQLVADAHAQSLPTHRHPRSQVACAFLCLVLREVLDGAADPDAALSSVKAKLERCYATQPAHTQELKIICNAAHRSAPTGTGYVVDTFWSALHVARRTSFAEAVRAAVALGHDTDTTACVAGAIAGAVHGCDAIPTGWVSVLRGREVTDSLAASLCTPRSRSWPTGERVSSSLSGSLSRQNACGSRRAQVVGRGPKSPSGTPHSAVLSRVRTSHRVGRWAEH
jgi:ADP-ribosylglycohydrolase